MKLVVIGMGPGGASVASTVSTFDREADVEIITQETEPPHRKPGASLAFETPNTDELAIEDWSLEKLNEQGVRVRLGTRVVNVHLDDKTLTIRGPDGTTSEVEFDKLVLATGGLPNIPDIPGADLEGTYTIQSRDDAAALGKRLSSLSKIAIIGAGFSGLEIADHLHKIGKEVHLIVRSRFMRRLLEPSMSLELESRIPADMILHKGKAPTAITGSKEVEGVEIGDEIVHCDAVLFMTGVIPNVSLAEEMGLDIGPSGAIVVDEHMETSAEDVYAVGDCAEMSDFLTGEPVVMPIGSTAARAGKQAGLAIVGRDKTFKDVNLRLQYDRIFDTDIVCVGHSSETARRMDIKTDVTFLDDDAEFAKIALVTDKDGILIGGQVIAPRLGSRWAYQILERVDERANLKESPLLPPQHDRMEGLLEDQYGPIR